MELLSGCRRLRMKSMECAPGFDVTFLGVTGAESIEDIRLHAEIVAAQPED